MIKLLILSAIVILSALLGATLASERRKAVRIFSEFCQFNENLIINLKYGRDRLETVASKFPLVSSAISGKPLLKGGDGQFIESYVKGLGTTDAHSQLDFLTQKGEGLKKLKEKSEENYKKYGKSYFVLCLMAGIIVAVLLA